MNYISRLALALTMTVALAGCASHKKSSRSANKPLTEKTVGAAPVATAPAPVQPPAPVAEKPAPTAAVPAAATPLVKSAANNPQVEEKFRQRHEGFLKDKEEALKKGPIELLFVGDSITDGWRNGDQSKLMQDRWGKYNPLNIGISGDRTEHVLWRLDNGEVDGLKPKAIMLMIGTNNLGTKQSPDDTIAGVTAVVAKLREKLPESKILLLAVFPRGNKADDAFRAQIKHVNEAIAKLDDGGQHVKYLDIADKFLAPDGELPKEIMPDFLHPNAKGYVIWADAVGPSLDEMLK